MRPAQSCFIYQRKAWYNLELYTVVCRLTMEQYPCSN